MENKNVMARLIACQVMVNPLKLINEMLAVVNPQSEMPPDGVKLITRANTVKSIITRELATIIQLDELYDMADSRALITLLDDVDASWTFGGYPYGICQNLKTHQRLYLGDLFSTNRHSTDKDAQFSYFDTEEERSKKVTFMKQAVVSNIDDINAMLYSVDASWMFEVLDFTIPSKEEFECGEITKANRFRTTIALKDRTTGNYPSVIKLKAKGHTGWPDDEALHSRFQNDYYWSLKAK